MRGATNSTPISIETIDLSAYSLGSNIDITDIGKKLAECDYYVLTWHDTRKPTYHIASVFTGHTAYGFATFVAVYEYLENVSPYWGGLVVQNTNANRINITTNVITAGGSWISYNGLVVLESIKIVKKGGGVS